MILSKVEFDEQPTATHQIPFLRTGKNELNKVLERLAALLPRYDCWKTLNRIRKLDDQICLNTNVSTALHGVVSTRRSYLSHHLAMASL